MKHTAAIHCFIVSSVKWTTAPDGAMAGYKAGSDLNARSPPTLTSRALE